MARAKATYSIEDGEVLAALRNADKIDAQAVGVALQRLRQKDGEIRPERLAEEARDPRHPCHQHFEWNDAKAASAYRVSQARCLIRIIRIEHADEFYRAFVSVPRAEGGRSYVTLSDVLNSRQLQDALLAQAQRDLEIWQQRYSELREIVKLAQPALDEIARKRGNPKARETFNEQPSG